MIRSYGAVQAVAKAIAEEATHVIDAYKKSRVVDEPHITDRFLGAIEARIRTMRFGQAKSTGWGGGLFSPIAWEAMTLRAGSGSAAHEKEFGADLLGVFSADIPNYKVTKGFLAQAKRAEPGRPFSHSEWQRLIDQCERMLSVTPEAFVIIYSKKMGIRFFSSIAVQGFNGRDIFEIYSLSSLEFFKRHFQCFIGDRRLDKPDIAVLKQLVEGPDEESARSLHVLSVKATLG